MIPEQMNPMQWHQAQGIARQSCARFFRDGGTPADALRAFGIASELDANIDWSRTVDAIAQTLCASPVRRAA